MAGAFVQDVTTATFHKDVIDASAEVPVLVDFWAPWCGPCRSLGPVLEKLAGELGGKVRVAKVNSDENIDLARQYNVRSIPDVRAFRNGREVGAFMGALPERQVRGFIDNLLDADRLDHAQALIAAGRHDDAEAEIALVADNIDYETRVVALRQAIAFARAGGSEEMLAAKVKSDPEDLEARLALAGAYASRKAWREAMDQLLEIIRAGKDWKDGEAKKQLLAIFSLCGDASLVSEYRRKLASAIY
jgi:putative thioredoxin